MFLITNAAAGSLEHAASKNKIKMITMKKILLSALLLTATTLALYAQDGKKRIHGENRKHHMMIGEQLKLTEEQKKKMQSLNEDYRKKMIELRKKEDITVKAWKEQMEALKKQHREDLQSLYTTEQKAQLEKMKLERKEKTKTHEKAQLERMKSQLGLSNEQTEQIMKQRTEMTQKMQALRENKSLDQAKKMEEMKNLMKTNKEYLKYILTEEQQKKMEELKKQQHGKKRRV